MQRPALTLDELTAGGRYDTVVVATPDLAGRLAGRRHSVRHFTTTAHRRVPTCDVVFGWGIAHEEWDGFRTIGWDHGYADHAWIPDLRTLRPMAWWPRTAVVIADVQDAAGRPYPASPRAVLQRQVQRAHDAGFHPTIGSELEFTIFAETPQSLRDKGYANLALRRPDMQPELVEGGGYDEDILGAIRAAMESSAIPVEYAKLEYSPGQAEITLAASDPVEMADRHALYKLGVREIARRHGAVATFIAKWHEDFGGSGCHVHLSLADSDGNALFANEDKYLMAFLGGIQRYCRDVFLLWAPFVNSYKRFRPGTFAPSSINWGEDNRTATLRITGTGTSRRLENRIAGADVNPYLAFAATLAAGLRGLEEGAGPVGGVEHRNAYEVEGLDPLPASLPEALDAFENSDFAREAFGDAVVDDVANFARKEEEAARYAVTDFERRRLFDI